MGLIDNEIRLELGRIFEDMKENVTISLFTQEGECYTCDETIDFMKEIESISDKIHFEHLDLHKDSDRASAYNVTMVPSIVLLNHKKEYVGVKFNGIPAGHEINSFIPALLMVSGAGPEMPEAMTKRIKAVDKPVNIKVFVTLSCPHCAGAVQKAHQIALLNPNIDAEMIEAQTFDTLSNQFKVSSVPLVVFNDDKRFVGNQVLDLFVEQIEKV